MKFFNFSTLLFLAVAGLLAWAAIVFVQNKPLNHEDCGVVVLPNTKTVTLTDVNTELRVKTRLINQSGRPIRIVGNNAC
jgi:hypothetical protein